MNGPLYSVFRSKCPKCNFGDLYFDPHPYHLKNIGKMKAACDRCGQKYEPETGFYYGAMYVSYAVSIILMFIPVAFLYFIFNADFKILLGTCIFIYITMYPLIFRWSRNIWLNIFVHYDPQLHEKIRKEIPSR